MKSWGLAAITLIVSTATSGSPQIPLAPQGPESVKIPHDIYGVTNYPLQLDLLTLATGLITLLALSALLYWLWKRLKKAPRPKAMEDPVEALYKKIAAFHPEEPFSRKEQLEYYFKLSMYFRNFMELTTKIPATDYTVSELIPPLRYKIPKLSGSADQIIKFLQRFDMIKFAEVPSSLEEARESHSQVLVWVKKLKPQKLPHEQGISKNERASSLKT